MKKLFDSRFRDWTPDLLPDLSGKTYVITGGNSGIGLEAAKMLAEAGGNIVIACRNESRAKAAVSEIDKCGNGKTDYAVVDLSSFASIRAAAKDVAKRFPKIDGLINNAGIMQTPERQTENGFELQFGTNHLGHFLWAGLLYKNVKAASGRIVVVSSIAHKFGRIYFDNLSLADKYSPTTAYCQSKLANLMFALELDRRLTRQDSAVTAYACHPGYANTQLQSTGPTGLLKALYGPLNAMVSQPAYNGAIPTVLCAAGVEALPGGYYGPQSMGEARGRVSDALVSDRARNEGYAAELWQVSEELSGNVWKF